MLPSVGAPSKASCRSTSPPYGRCTSRSSSRRSATPTSSCRKAARTRLPSSCCAPQSRTRRGQRVRRSVASICQRIVHYQLELLVAPVLRDEHGHRVVVKRLSHVSWSVVSEPHHSWHVEIQRRRHIGRRCGNKLLEGCQAGEARRLASRRRHQRL